MKRHGVIKIKIDGNIETWVIDLTNLPEEVESSCADSPNIEDYYRVENLSMKNSSIINTRSMKEDSVYYQFFAFAQQDMYQKYGSKDMEFAGLYDLSDGGDLNEVAGKESIGDCNTYILVLRFLDENGKNYPIAMCITDLTPEAVLDVNMFNLLSDVSECDALEANRRDNFISADSGPRGSIHEAFVITEENIKNIPMRELNENVLDLINFNELLKINN